MKTKTSILILVLIAAIILAVVFITKAKNKQDEINDAMMNPSGQTTLGTETTAQPGETPIVEPGTPVNPEFPVTGFEPAQ